jgi:(p)ppGpp synthase/HD superfamily hydrolase
VFTDRFEQALVFSHQLHRRQRRKTSGVPYIGHPLGVAALVIEDGGSESETIAALLHDSLEDQGRAYPGGVPALAAEIESRFGQEVRRIVEACTECATEEELRIDDRRLRWRAHKLGYLEQIRAADPSVRRVSCADSLHNVRTMLKDYQRMGEKLWTRFMTRNGGDQVWAYRAMAEAFVATGMGTMAQDLARAVEELADAIRCPVTSPVPAAPEPHTP